MKVFWSLLTETFNNWMEDKAPRLAAALAFYAIFSMAPILIVAIAVAGAVFGEEAARGAISAQISSLIGESGADLIETAISRAARPGAGSIATLIGVVTLLFGATGVFAQLQDALNTVWNVQPIPGRPLVVIVKQRFTAFTLVLGIGFLLLVSLVISALLSALDTYLQTFLPDLDFFLRISSIVLSFGVTTLLFAMIYKLLPDVQIGWSDVWTGAAVTALLFSLGKYLIGLYLGNSAIGSVYGAAGSLAIVLIWIYYSGLILFFGAEFTQVYACRYGSRIVPAPGAMPLSSDGTPAPEPPVLPEDAPDQDPAANGHAASQTRQPLEDRS